MELSALLGQVFGAEAPLSPRLILRVGLKLCEPTATTRRFTAALTGKYVETAAEVHANALSLNDFVRAVLSTTEMTVHDEQL